MIHAAGTGKFMLFVFGFVFALLSVIPTELYCCGNNEEKSVPLQCPEITFAYDWRSSIMDTIFSVYYGNDVTDDLLARSETLLPKLVAAWKQTAPLLFEEVFSVFKRGFRDRKRTAIINLSHYYSYGSHWFLILSLRSYVEAEKWNRSISLEYSFVSTVFHELLHIWLDDNFDENKSCMLAKYHNENIHVLSHIHLMAIEKMVYLKINRPDIAAYIANSYCNFCSPEYRRSWEIVNDVEGYETIIQDVLASLYVTLN